MSIWDTTKENKNPPPQKELRCKWCSCIVNSKSDYIDNKGLCNPCYSYKVREKEIESAIDNAEGRIEDR